MTLTHGCGRLTCQYCYGDDISESEIAFYTEQRIRRGGVKAPAPPKPPAPPRPAPPTPLPHATARLTTDEMIGGRPRNYG